MTTTPAAPGTLLFQRRIEASILRPFLHRLVAELGEDRARALVQETIAAEARAQGCARWDPETTGLEPLARAWTEFAAGGALDVERVELSGDTLRVRVTRCRYVELYRDLGLERWGPLLSCGRDGPFAEGLCPGTTMTRSLPLMEGGAHCEFTYTKGQP